MMRERDSRILAGDAAAMAQAVRSGSVVVLDSKTPPREVPLSDRLELMEQRLDDRLLNLETNLARTQSYLQDVLIMLERSQQVHYQSSQSMVSPRFQPHSKQSIIGNKAFITQRAPRPAQIPLDQDPPGIPENAAPAIEPPAAPDHTASNGPDAGLSLDTVRSDSRDKNAPHETDIPPLKLNENNPVLRPSEINPLAPGNEKDTIPTRRFSMSSIVIEKRRESRVDKAIGWSKKLFHFSSNDASVSPDDIHTARLADGQVHRWTIRHDGNFRYNWDFLVTIMILVDMCLTPMALGFNLDTNFLTHFNIVTTCVFGADFLINMFSSYTNERGVLFSGPKRTIPYYLFGPWSIPDFLSWFPFEYTLSRDRGRFLGSAKIVRLTKVSQLARRMHSSKKAGLFRFIRLIGVVCLVSHTCTCWWHWIAKEWRANAVNWNDQTLFEKYAHCWSLVIGALNASPPAMFNIKEELSIACFMLTGNIIQASVFGAVAVLISSIDEEEAAYNKKLISTYERCKFLDIPEPLARRIQAYYENMYRETRSINGDADSFINELSPALICEVKFQLYRDMLTQIPFLSGQHLDSCVTELLVLHLRTVIYMQDDVVIRKGEHGDWMGFIGSKGCVGVLDPNSLERKIIRILRKGDYFGEMALLHRAKRSTTAIALTWVQIHVLCRDDLESVRDQYPEQAAILEREIQKYMKAKVQYK